MEDAVETPCLREVEVHYVDGHHVRELGVVPPGRKGLGVLLAPIVLAKGRWRGEKNSGLSARVDQPRNATQLAPVNA